MPALDLNVHNVHNVASASSRSHRTLTGATLPVMIHMSALRHQASILDHDRHMHSLPGCKCLACVTTAGLHWLGSEFVRCRHDCSTLCAAGSGRDALAGAARRLAAGGGVGRQSERRTGAGQQGRHERPQSHIHPRRFLRAGVAVFADMSVPGPVKHWAASDGRHLMDVSGAARADLRCCLCRCLVGGSTTPLSAGMASC